MPDIQFEWLDQSRNIIRVDYPHGWAWEDYHHVLDRIGEVLGDQPDPVIFVNVYPEGVQLAQSAPGSHWRRTVRVFKVDFVVYVTQDPMLKAMLRRFLHTIDFTEGKQYTFVASVEAALAFLDERL